MSGLASVLYPPATPNGFTEWSFSHYGHHQAIINAAASTGKGRLLMYQIWPVNSNDLESWLLQHQQMHDDMNTLYGLNGSDLTSLDFKSKRQVDAFFEIHYYEHLDVAQACGLPI